MVMLPEDRRMNMLDRQVLGGKFCIRIDIPTTTAVSLKDAAAELRRLAQEIEFTCSRSNDLRERDIVAACMMAARSYQTWAKGRIEQDRLMIDEDETETPRIRRVK